MMERQREKLSNEQEGPASALLVSKQSARQSLITLDVENVLKEIAAISEKGGKFMGIANDYKKVSKQEERKAFSFVPDTMALNPGEFREALLTYAKENNKDIVITKECMYPEFEMGGVEYVADRGLGFWSYWLSGPAGSLRRLRFLWGYFWCSFYTSCSGSIKI